MWKVAEDGSVLDQHGRVIFFSVERFVRDICLGECCFICGASPGDKPFNNEHILPEWLLRKYSLFDQAIGLPNEATVKYGQYTIPCCVDCNSLMGERVEKPLSEVIGGGTEAIRKFMDEGETLKLIVWMGLIFLKTHLRDRVHRFHLDARMGVGKIADEYDWEYLHHLHTIVRCFYTGSIVEREAVGSFLVISVDQPEIAQRFDFGDLYLAQTMMLRLDDFAMLVVFNDSGGVMSYFHQRLKRITGPLSEVQLREVLAEFAYLNLLLKKRPTFHTECDVEQQECRTVAVRPELELDEPRPDLRGKLLHHALRGLLPHLQMAGVTDEEFQAVIKAGRMTFLFDDQGRFIANSVRRL